MTHSVIVAMTLDEACELAKIIENKIWWQLITIEKRYFKDDIGNEQYGYIIKAKYTSNMHEIVSKLYFDKLEKYYQK